jgi:CheY-like chemotaxis protein
MPRILVVEDNEDNRKALARRLERRGFDVLTAADGNVGRDTAVAERPDLVLMDMNMPELDGWEATRSIAADPRTRGVPVIALTAHSMTGDRERALAAGCADYHAKPVDFSRLLAQIETLLKRAAPDRPLPGG